MADRMKALLMHPHLHNGDNLETHFCRRWPRTARHATGESGIFVIGRLCRSIYRAIPRKKFSLPQILMLIGGTSDHRNWLTGLTRTAMPIAEQADIVLFGSDISPSLFMAWSTIINLDLRYWLYNMQVFLTLRNINLRSQRIDRSCKFLPRY